MIDLQALRTASIEMLAAARDFQMAQPWTHYGLHNSFALGDREDPTYCTILGAEGQLFGIAVFPGATGRQSFQELESADDDGQLRLRYLQLSFRDLEALPPDGADLLVAAGWEGDGNPQQWLSVLSSLPGHMPWAPDLEETLLLTEAMQAALALMPLAELPAAMQARKGQQIGWVGPEGIEWLDLDRSAMFRADQLDLSGLPSEWPAGQGTWWFGRTFLPELQLPGRRPAIAEAWVLLDMHSGAVVAAQAVGPDVPAAEQTSFFVEAFRHVGHPPAELVTAQARDQRLLQPLGRKMGMNVFMEADSDLREDLRPLLTDHFGS